MLKLACYIVGTMLILYTLIYLYIISSVSGEMKKNNEKMYQIMKWEIHGYAAAGFLVAGAGEVLIYFGKMFL